MSIFNNFLRVLGFQSDTDADFDEDYGNEAADEPDTPLPSPETKPAEAPEAEINEATESVEIVRSESEIDSIAGDMMASVVELFNSFQPEFIARCLDSDRQRLLIAENLGPALRDRLAAIAHAERLRIEKEAAEERAAIDADLKRMRERNAELEDRRAAFKNEQLSATRQKRALQERIHDLEAQNDQLAADKEQLELENRSMANKLRVAGISAPAPTASLPSSPLPKVPATPELPGLESTDGPDDRSQQIAQLSAANEALVARLNEAEKQHKADTEELEDLREQISQIQVIAEQAEKVAELAEKKDARIAELKTRVKNAEEAYRNIERLEKENKSLRNTIEANLYEHAAEMAGLRQELEEIRKKAPRRGRPRKEPSDEMDHIKSGDQHSRARKTPRISAIDELIEGSEWLVAPTPEEVNVPIVEDSSDDFGYKEPVRKPAPQDDANQLTLF